MNIFWLSDDPVQAAEMQCDKHICKMIVETAQLLSTAHRVCDGTSQKISGKSGRMKTWWSHPNAERDDNLYSATHVNHPSAKWVREGTYNYYWLYHHFVALLAEYTYRYGKRHATSRLQRLLENAPHNIPDTATPIPLCMKSAPECINESDPVQSYRNFYKTKQTRFKMTWTRRAKPDWF